MISKKLIVVTAILFFFPAFSASAYWVWSPEKGEFVNSEGGGSGAAEEQFDYAMKFYNEKKLDDAAKQFEDLVKKNPAAKVASEAQYRIGTIYEEQGDYQKAFQAYKKLIETYPQSERFNEVIEREFRIGNLFLSGKKGKLMGLEIMPALPRAAEVFEHIVKQAPFSDYGAQAQFHLGLTYKQMGNFDGANEAFQAVIDKYPQQTELVAQARFQLAETSFDRSKKEYRDQRALDDASKQVDKFLEKYPDAASSEKASKLRQVIDEKNAEKNYRIGHYYEKEDYIDSALIYYSDVAAKYPNTEWGSKAAQKMNVLKNPAQFKTEKEKEILQEIEVIKRQMAGLAESDKTERERLETRLAELEKQRVALGKQEKEGLKSREADIKRRERELKERFKRLDEKKKLMKTNPSEDFKRAIERWHASLVEEQEQLALEKRQLQAWRIEMGLGPSKARFDWWPWGGEGPDELEVIRSIDAKKLYKISSEKSKLLEEKEALYKEYVTLSTAAGEAPLEEAKVLPPLALPEKDRDYNALIKAAGPDFKSQQEKLTQTHDEIAQLEKELEEKRTVYEKNYGRPNWLVSIGVPVKPGRAMDFFNPFGHSEQEIKKLGPEELAELQSHLREQEAAQQNLTDTLTQAFDRELAMQEQRRLMQTLSDDQQMSPEELRKSIKALERDIRTRFQEIQDRHERKKELLKELDTMIRQKEASAGPAQKTGKILLTPAVAMYRFGHAFLFGMQATDKKIADSAKSLSKRLPEGDEIKALKDQLELESVMIEAQTQEIARLRQELEILRAKASLMGGYKFRSAYVKVPYGFIEEAVEGAKRVVPTKSREEILLERMDIETKKLEVVRADIKKVDEEIQRRGAQAKAAEDQKAAPASGAGDSKDAKDKNKSSEKNQSSVPPAAELKKDMEEMAKELEVKRGIFEREKALLRTQLEGRPGASAIPAEKEQNEKAAAGPAKPAEKPKPETKEKRRQRKDLNEIREDLADIIAEEDKLEADELTILDKRVEATDRAIAKVQSKALQQDLLTEKKRMEERLTQIKARREFLAKELGRFQNT